MCAILALSPRAAAAQTPAPSNIVGTVFDSIRMRPMSGAVVRVDSSALLAIADAEGRFRLDGIPAGRHELRVEHPILDTLGINLRSNVIDFAPGATTAHQFAAPSPETLVNLTCAPGWRARGPGALMGRVREADTGTPAKGAKVSLVWYELDVVGSLKRVPRVREAVVGADGTYRLCGLPAELDGKVQVLRGPLTSGEIAVSFGEDILFLRSMSIATPGAVVTTSASSADTQRVSGRVVSGAARLTGRVLNRSGAPLVGARVQLEGTQRATSTR